MSSTFGSLSTALSGLFASRRGLDLTSQNLANVNTDGYSRQRADLVAITGPVAPALFARWDGAGGGVNVADIARFRDTFLESRAHSEHSNAASLAVAQTSYARIEDGLGEPGANGLQATMAKFWSSFDDVANNPGDLAARSALLQRATAVSDSFGRGRAAADQLWASTSDQLSTTIADVNASATTVANLNKAIRNGTQAGLPVNELMDQRDLMVMHLAETVGATVRSQANGVVDVYVNGQALVRADSTTTLQIASGGPTKLDDYSGTPVPNPQPSVQLQWTSQAGTYPVSGVGGGVGGMLGALNTTIPGQSNALDAIATQLATTVNAQHTVGYDLNGNAGIALFAVTGASTSAATNLSVAITDPRLVAASGVAGAANLDNANALSLAALASQTGGTDEVYRQYVVNLGVKAQSINQQVAIQTTVTSQVDASRESQSGVSIDEEMTSMLAYQRAYEAAGRVMTAVDSTLNTLINATGLVGR